MSDPKPASDERKAAHQQAIQEVVDAVNKASEEYHLTTKAQRELMDKNDTINKLRQIERAGWSNTTKRSRHKSQP